MGSTRRDLPRLPGALGPRLRSALGGPHWPGVVSWRPWPRLEDEHRSASERAASGRRLARTQHHQTQPPRSRAWASNRPWTTTLKCVSHHRTSRRGQLQGSALLTVHPGLPRLAFTSQSVPPSSREQLSKSIGAGDHLLRPGDSAAPATARAGLQSAWARAHRRAAGASCPAATTASVTPQATSTRRHDDPVTSDG